MNVKSNSNTISFVGKNEKTGHLKIDARLGIQETPEIR